MNELKNLLRQYKICLNSKATRGTACLDNVFSNVNMEFRVTEVVYFPFSDQNALVCNLSNIKLDSDVLDLNVFTKVVISRPLNHVNINNFKDEQGNFDWDCLIGRYHNF